MRHRLEHRAKTALAGTMAVLCVGLATAAFVSAQQSGADQGSAVQNAALAPGAPRWAKWASSSVFAIFTPKGQAMAKALRAAALSAGPSIQSVPETSIVFGQSTFNKDTTVLAQNETTVVFDPLNTLRVVGGYNDYRGEILATGDLTGWTIASDGKTPAKDGELQQVSILGTKEPSGGDPALAADSAGNYFMGSLYYDPNISTTGKGNNGVVIARSPKFGSAQGVFSAACPGGDGNLNCWPTTKVVVGETCDLINNLGHMHDKDYIAADDSNSVAKGSVYVVWTRFSCNAADFSDQILLAKCTNSLSSCTAPFTLESTTGTGGSIDFLQLSHITVSPVNGKVYVTWNKFLAPSSAIDPAAVVTDTIRMRVITPTSLTTSVGTAGPLRTVTTEAQPIPFSTFPYPGLFRIATYPHVGVMGGRAIVVWDRRTTKSFLLDTYFFDSDILARFTDNDGVSFSADQVVSSAPSFQYQPSICVSPASSRVVVSYFSSQNDLVSKHRQDEYVATSTTGAAPYTPLRVTPVSNITENNPILGDSFIGDYQEAACGTNFAYLHYTANYTAKSDALFNSPAVIIPQQDNFLAKVTLP